MLNIDNIDPIKNFFSNEKIQEKVFSFLKKNNYQIINEEEYLDRSFDINITQGKPLPQIKNVGFLGIMSIKEVNSIQEKRTFKKLQKQITRILDNRCAPITIDRNGYIINGHHRYDALKILKKKKIPVRVLNLNASDIIDVKLPASDLMKIFKIPGHIFANYRPPDIVSRQSLVLTDRFSNGVSGQKGCLSRQIDLCFRR